MRILVAGAGIAGLGAALALTGKGHAIELIERDQPPPTGDMNEVFDTWERKGATQVRHSHGFTARIVKFFKTYHPSLHQRLVDAGSRQVGFRELLTPLQQAKYRAVPKDDEINVLSCRRTTLEAITRRYVEECSDVVFRTGCLVRGLVCETGADGAPSATALKVVTPDGVEETWPADLVIDATGRNSPFQDWLADSGVRLEAETAPAGIIYATRNYRLRDGAIPPKLESRVGGDFGFIRGGVYPTDNGNFSITLMVPEIETEMRQVMLNPETFETFVRMLPGFSEWIEPERVTPTSKVLAMGDLKSVWPHWVKDGKPAILNFFPVGDAHSRTNPLYGRGCTIAMMHAEALAEVLRESGDPIERAKLYQQRVYRDVRPYYDAMATQDKASIQRAKDAQNPDYKPDFRAKLQKNFAEHAVQPAMTGHVGVLRAFVRSGLMLDAPNAWMQNPRVLATLLAMWATPKRFKKDFYLQAIGGASRNEFVTIAQERLKHRDHAA
jgi:2-polyprenyl-6-methoxyphenol hydroxylase-like FAD-dependent oxidoreductase